MCGFSGIRVNAFKRDVALARPRYLPFIYTMIAWAPYDRTPRFRVDTLQKIE
jgi:hypothetical protein